jgi:hypothetical protein
MSAPRVKALDVVRGLADETLRSRFKAMRAPKQEPIAAPQKEADFSEEDEEQLARLYEEETAANGRA